MQVRQGGTGMSTKGKAYRFVVVADSSAVDYIMLEDNDRKTILHVGKRHAVRPSYDTQGAMDLWRKLKGRKIRTG